MGTVRPGSTGLPFSLLVDLRARFKPCPIPWGGFPAASPSGFLVAPPLATRDGRAKVWKLIKRLIYREALVQIPSTSTPPDALLARMRTLREGDANWRGGRCFALVYSAGEAHDALLADAHRMFHSENGLNPMAFKSVRRMEHELVRMTASLLRGDAQTTGCVTSGGTESLLLAVLAYRNAATEGKKKIDRPEIIAPASIHVAVEKAAHLFGVTLRLAPLRDDYRVDVDAMRRMIGPRTAALMVSAPQYPHGVIDPVSEVAALASEKGLPLHVDACIGGFVLPFLEELGEPIPAWDFRVPGVTSISCDLHKYAYGAKGTSVLLWRTIDDMKHQFFVSTEWPGGIYASPTLPGTRPAGPIAASWAGVQAMGREGYLALTRRTLDARARLLDGIEATPGLRVVAPPESTLIAFESTDRAIDIYALADRLQARGWHFDRNQSPRSLHLTVMAAHAETAPEFIHDLRACVDELRRSPRSRRQGTAPMYGMMARLPARGLVRAAVLDAMVGMYGPNPKDPMAADTASPSLLDRAVQRLGGPVLGLLDRVDAVRDRWRPRR